jgi:ABC-type polysaccharide/polyol phosphate export permease
VLAAAAYGTLAIGLATDRFAFSFMPEPGRVPLILAMLCGTLPYFAADEWLTRGAGAPHGAYAATKILFLASLALAIALNLQRLFFLVIIIPAILALFVIYGLFSAWTYERTLHPLVGAVANALAFAWAIAVTFPIVSR